MDSFDKLIKERIQKEDWSIPEGLDNKLNQILINISSNKTHKKIPIRVLIAAALITILTATSVFAVSSPEAVKNVIAFFNGKTDIKYKSDEQELQKYNNAVGFTTVDKGIKLTVDSIAVDDNFLNVFYTIESDKPIPRDENEHFSAFFASPFLNYKINGKALTISNNNDMEAYFESDYKLKGMKRENLSKMTLPEKFKIDISTNKIFKTDGDWHISASIDKSKAEADTKTITPKQKASISINNVTHKISIDKLSISPFGNQIVISEKVSGGKHSFSNFALFDDKGNSLDVLSTDLTESSLGKTTNAFEFIKANKDIEYLTLVPIRTWSDNAPKPLDDPVANINKLPITLKVGQYGSIIVDDIAFTQNQIKVTYHKDGVTMFDPGFKYLDKDGKEVELNKGSLDKAVDRQNGRYTQIYTSYVSSCDFSKIAKVSAYADEKIELLYDQKIRIDLKK